jgi:hypothetical protein
MQIMYVLGSETHVHNDYIVGHHHTLLKIIAEIVIYCMDFTIDSKNPKP